MKTLNFLCSALLLLASCKENPESIETVKNDQELSKNTKKTPEKDEKMVKFDFSWKGKIDEKTPVFVHFQLEDSVVFGEIVYLNTKKKLPIQLIGQQMEGGILRILEMDKTGYVSGILTGMMHGSEFKGEWFSPKSRKDLPFDLKKNDSLVPSKILTTETKDCYGHYHYQFGPEGATGGFSLKKNREKSLFEISCVTSSPSYHLAILEETEVKLENSQINYPIKEEPSCNFKVRFFQGFAVIDYTNGDCENGYFGHNAHVEGIFMKTK